MTKLAERLIRPEILQLHAYHVPDSSGYVKLDAMENPYNWDDEIRDNWLNDLKRAQINRYPEPDPTYLKQGLRDIFEIPSDADLLLGNGSDEIIQMLAMALARPGCVVLAPEPTFVMYRMISVFTGVTFVGVPLRADFSLDVAAMLDAIEAHQPSLVFIAYPNNPTGNLFDRRDIEKIIEQCAGLVVLDEAYSAFADDTFMPDLVRFPNLLVMRTLSKMGLAGLRLGYIAGEQGILSEINKVRLPYNINVLTQLSVEFALKNKTVFDQQTIRIKKDRALVEQELSAISGLTIYPSQANFITFKVPKGDGARIFSLLKEARILIKNLGANGGMLADCLRVTIGTPQENHAFITALSSVLQA